MFPKQPNDQQPMQTITKIFIINTTRRTNSRLKNGTESLIKRIMDFTARQTHKVSK